MPTPEPLSSREQILETLISCLRALDALGATIPALHLNAAIEALLDIDDLPPTLS